MSKKYESGGKIPPKSRELDMKQINPYYTKTPVPSIQKLGDITFDSNKSRTDEYKNLIVKDIKTGKDFGVVRKPDGSYEFLDDLRVASTKVKAFYKNALNSSSYRRRLGVYEGIEGSKGADVIKLIQNVNNHVQQTSLSENSSEDGSYYTPNKIVWDKNQLPGADIEDILAHEFSHAKRVNTWGKQLLNYKDKNDFTNMDMFDAYIKPAKDGKKYDDHDRSIEERAADLDALRYNLKKFGILSDPYDGIYNYDFPSRYEDGFFYHGTQSRDSSNVMDAIKNNPKIKDQFTTKRIKELFKEDKIIDALNDLSQSPQQETNTTAQYGGTLNMKKKLAMGGIYDTPMNIYTPTQKDRNLRNKSRFTTVMDGLAAAAPMVAASMIPGVGGVVAQTIAPVISRTAGKNFSNTSNTIGATLGAASTVGFNYKRQKEAEAEAAKAAAEGKADTEGKTQQSSTTTQSTNYWDNPATRHLQDVQASQFGYETQQEQYNPYSIEQSSMMAAMGGLLKKAYGGNVPSLMKTSSGEDQPLASDAMEIQGNANTTDGNYYQSPSGKVQLDHNEVVKGDKVFSSKLTIPGMKMSYADMVKPLMKAKGEAQKKVNYLPTNEFAKNTIKMTNQMVDEDIFPMQEKHATALGLREPTHKFQYGGNYGDPVGPSYTPYDPVRTGFPYPTTLWDQSVQTPNESELETPVQFSSFLQTLSPNSSTLRNMTEEPSPQDPYTIRDFGPNFDPLPNRPAPKSINFNSRTSPTTEQIRAVGNTQIPIVPKSNFWKDLTVGDKMQLAAAASKLVPALQKTEVQKAYLDNTPIKKQSYDVSPVLGQNAANYSTAMNGIQTGNLATRNAIASSLYGKKTNADSQALTQYDRMNQESASRYSSEISNRQRYNNQVQQNTDVINSQNRANKYAAIDNAFNQIGQVGQSFNQKKYQQQQLALLKEVYRDMPFYDRLEKAMREGQVTIGPDGKLITK